MITIFFSNDATENEFKYEGDIEIYLSEPFITISASRMIQDTDDLDIGEEHIIDKFWIEDIISIKGE